MDALEDAIEDAQYVGATQDGPRPVETWRVPEEGELATWKSGVLSGKNQSSDSSKTKDGSNDQKLTPFEFEWTLAHALGFFLFSAYLKSDAVNDYVGINFMEEVLKWKNRRGRFRAEKTSFIVAEYLSPLSPKAAAAIASDAARAGEDTASAVGSAPPPLVPERSRKGTVFPTPTARPEKTQIYQWDLARKPTAFNEDEIREIRGSADSTANYLGVGGEVLELIMSRVDKLRKSPGYESLTEVHNEDDKEENVNLDVPKEKPSEEQLEKKRSIRKLSIISNELPDSLFDAAEVIVAEDICEKHWAGFQKSEFHTKLLNFLWFQDKPVVEDDFFFMRVLGRGGFGLVTACKKSTSGKLYAMKAQNKKRIKLGKSEELVITERECLENVDSPFVVNLNYSFQTQTDVFLVLDLMTGGDLSYHLSKRGSFPKEECLYYCSRILLGLQALHDKGYIYRDLKPENCLLGEDGRVKLTDLGLATKVTPNLRGPSGTRGWWAPEMLRRDEDGKRTIYNKMVDWFSFRVCLAEFMSGENPFRSEEAIIFGFEKEKALDSATPEMQEMTIESATVEVLEKAIDCATLEMHPVFDSEKFDEDASDICRLLLDKDETTRLGVNGIKEIMVHPWFRDVSWEETINDRTKPPFIPSKNVNAVSQGEIGAFEEDKTLLETVLSDKDEAVYGNWNLTNSKSFAAEVIEFLIYERETGEPLLPRQPNTSSCCCTIM